jgi:hypothetical protein
MHSRLKLTMLPLRVALGYYGVPWRGRAAGPPSPPIRLCLDVYGTPRAPIQGILTYIPGDPMPNDLAPGPTCACGVEGCDGDCLEAHEWSWQGSAIAVVQGWDDLP